MAGHTDEHGLTQPLVIGVTPFNAPDVRLVSAVCHGGGLGILDLGQAATPAREALDRLRQWTDRPFGVRAAEECALRPEEVLRGEIDTVLLGHRSPWVLTDLVGQHRVLVEVTSSEQALSAVADGATGLVAVGNEAGGHVGELSSFVLLQRLVEVVDVPIWVRGGIGVRTAAAAVVGGAAGVVLDSQLALLAEADLDDSVAAAVRPMDGSETVVVSGRRMLARHGTVDASIPVGQDGFLAARFADQYGGASQVIRAMRDSVLDAVSRRPAAPALIVQGPMTRVSDQAAFAASVAEHGGLPFVALALADGEQTRSLLTDTAAAVGDRAWGAGILGFADEDVRAAQLAVIHELRPPHVIIAGGRPSQAQALERRGISAFLHVPSPGLLEQFLATGARRFVFEGSECGGHVGPRASFPLWEAQIAVLLDFLDSRPDHSEKIEVLFAGGVHDERSAAMVMAMAVPLCDRSVTVGVLMGTAYLFTEEAVRDGAILPAFQRQIVSADRTALLETAPGHATRCVASPFADSFPAIRTELSDRGLADREVWAELERLNVGRLRIASKGVRRENTGLVELNEQRQLAEGMFMAGQVAVLRSAVTTIAALHAAVTSGAVDYLAGRASALGIGRPEPDDMTRPLDVAIIGMSCMFPKSPDLASFWSLVLDGVDAVTEVPAGRWEPEIYYSAEGGRDRTLSKWGGFLPEINFDPLRYGIPPASLASIEPVQLLALEAADRALRHAGYGAKRFDRSRTSVVFGSESGSDLSNATVLRTVLPSYLGTLPQALAEQLPTLTEDSFPGMLANVIAGRIANRLDLGGTNYTVDAACASSLAAVDVACKELVADTSDLVLCGAADLHNGINDYLMFSSVGALSPTGRCRTFDSSADGITLGEGVACVVLKRLADAQRDGDTVYAVIKGVGSASDGKSLGLTAPRPEGQRNALERAYRNAGLSPADVGLVEAHGTGTVVGDRTELSTLTKVFVDGGATPGTCALGSVKSQIGHTKCASGLAGLIKTALALYHGIKPPTLHVSRPNPAWRPQESPFTLNAEPVPWPVAPGERVAGVSAFGFGGTNFHVVLTGYTGSPAPRHSGDQWPAELFVFRGADHRAACRSVERLLDVAAANEVNGRPWRLRDLAKTASLLAPRSTEPVRIAVVAATLDDLTHLLRRAVAGEHDPESGLFGQAPVEGKLAFLFPGQGSQHTGMLAELFVAFPEAQHLLGLDDQLTALIYPPAAFDKETRRDNDSRLRDTRAAQPALGIAGLAINHLLGRLRIRPDMLAGHSYGELVALSAAGSFGPTTLLELSRARAESIIASTGADPGAMAAVSATAEQVAPLLTDQVVIANYNGPDQVVISGPTAGVERAIEVLRAAGHSAKPIPVACAFHSAVVAGAGERFGQFLSSADIRPPELPVWGNRTAREYGADVRTELVAQIGAPVGFVTQVEAMYAAGARIFVEVGPGAVLTRLVASILGDRPHVRVPTDGGLRGFLCAVAQLAVCGIPVSTGWLFDGRDAVEANADDVPKRPGWTVDGHLVRTSDGSYLAGGLAPARRVEVPMTAGHGDRSNKDALISEYLRTSRELIAAQRDVLLSYFGGVADAPMRVGPTASAGAMAEVTASGPPIAEVAPEPEPAGVDVLGTVLNVISERTGYPVDMIDPGLDLEADLSIDSIKRTEIAGCLVERLRAGSDVDVDELAKVRTARALADLCAGVDQTEKQAEAQPAAVTGRQPRRFQLLDTAVGGVDAEDVSVLNGSSFVLVGGSAELRDQLTALLTGHGAALADIGADRIDGLIYLEPLTAGDDPVLPQAYPLFRSVLGAAPRWVFAAAPADDRHADRVAGLRGFFRTLSREYPDVRTRLVEIECGATTEVAATTLLRELLTDGARPVVRYIDGVAHTVDMVAAELGSLGTTGAGPAGDGTAEVRAIGLDRESVVLLVGGARGITARLAATLALTSGCRIELVGRTRLPAEREDPATAGVADRAGLRAALAGLGHRSPAEVDRLAGGILAAREVAATVAELRRLGSPVRYHSADVLDADGLHRVVKEIHADHGRLDGVVYAAGVIEDKLVADKDHESFRRVFNTKVDGVRALLEAVDGLPSAPGFTILFGSIAATLGNRGQIDYSAANDAVQTLGSAWARRTGNRLLTVHWGPWAPDGTHGGMVTPELARDYAGRGIELIDPEEGMLALLRELAFGDHTTRAVVYTASGW